VREKGLVLDISYGLGFARDRTHTVNPFPILANSPLQAGAYNYPDVINRQQEANATLTYKISAAFEVGGQYRYEPVSPGRLLSEQLVSVHRANSHYRRRTGKRPDAATVVSGCALYRLLTRTLRLCSCVIRFEFPTCSFPLVQNY
jgi:hypothetical protein